MASKILFKELSYLITGICFKVQNDLGRFAKEIQYAQRFEQILKEKQLNYLRESKQPFNFNDDKVSGNVVDFIVENKIIIELKARPVLLKIDYFQVQRYLKATNMELGLLINFHDRYLKPKRILNIKNKNLFVDSDNS